MEGQILEGRVRIGPPIGGNRDALFAAEWVGITGPEIVVRIYSAGGQPLFERHMEASFLEHPNLLRCFGAGEFYFHGSLGIYAVLARFDTTLTSLLQNGPLSPEETAQLGRQLSNALAYLHRQDLVCCHLDPATITRTAGVWQIGDYSQMRVAGSVYTPWTSPAIDARPEAPPEARDGLVTPAWDSWSLGGLLRTALAGARSTAALPEPLNSVVIECGQTDPRQRCRMERIRVLLDGAAMAAHPSGTVAADPPCGSMPVPGRIRYLKSECPGTAAPPVPVQWLQAVRDAPVSADRTLTQWWEENGLKSIAAGIAAAVLIMLLFTFLPDRSDAAASREPAQIEKPAGSGRPL